MDNPYKPGNQCHAKCKFFNSKYDFKICLEFPKPDCACGREEDPEFCPFVHTPPPIMNDVVKAMNLWDFPDGRRSTENMDLFPGRYEEMMWKKKHCIIVLGFRNEDYMSKWHSHSKIHIYRNDDFTEVQFWVEPNSSVCEDGEKHFNRVMARCKEIMEAWRWMGLKIMEG